MKAEDCNVGDIIAISGGTVWEIKEIPHPDKPTCIAVVPGPGNQQGPSSQPFGYYWHSGNDDVSVITIQPTPFTPANTAKYLYKTFTGYDYKPLKDEEVNDWINQQIAEGYEFITLDAARNWAAVTLVKYE